MSFNSVVKVEYVDKYIRELASDDESCSEESSSLSD